jgi:hypothetical protein
VADTVTVPLTAETTVRQVPGGKREPLSSRAKSHFEAHGAGADGAVRDEVETTTPR